MHVDEIAEVKRQLKVTIDELQEKVNLAAGDVEEFTRDLEDVTTSLENAYENLEDASRSLDEAMNLLR